MVAAPAAEDRVAPPSSPYAGIVTRAVALGIDACVIWTVALGVGGLLALIGSLVGGLRLSPVGALLGGTTVLVVNAVYFAVSWTVAGRTVGQRLMQLHVVDERGLNPRFLRSLLRAVVMGACVACACLGFVTVLFDRRRRGPHDMAARTTVRYDGVLSAI